MKILRPIWVTVFLVLLIFVGRWWGGVPLVLMGVFFLTVLIDITALLLCLLSFIIDMLFLLPLGISLSVLSVAHLLFPYFRNGIIKTVLFFLLFYIFFFLFFPHFSLLKLSVILIFPILLYRIQLRRSKMYELG